MLTLLCNLFLFHKVKKYHDYLKLLLDDGVPRPISEPSPPTEGSDLIFVCPEPCSFYFNARMEMDCCLF